MTKRRFGLGLIVGALAGVVAGLLTAPKSGKETRDDLKRKADTVKKDMTAKAGEAKGKAAEAVEGAKEKADDLKRRAENAVEGAKAGFNNSTTKHTKK